jgi:Recombination directionality factor-like
MSVLDLQRKGQQIGRIRIGQQVAIVKDGRDTGKTRPARLDTFRFTTASRNSADAIAELFGGEVREWNKQWEVITGRSEISVMVPPRDAVISQWYEQWNAGGAIRRCDSQHDQISNGPCQCPHAADPDNQEEADRAALRRAEMAKLNPPQACHLITRVSVMIPDLPGVGVFRLDTGSFYAAAEIGDTAYILQKARDAGVFLPAVLRIEQRQRVAGGQTKKYPVPVLEILSTLRQIVGGELAAGGVAAQLPPAPGEQRKAITASAAPLPAPTGIPAGADDDAEVVDAVIVNDWLDSTLAAAMTFTSEGEGRRLWRESAAKAHAGEITAADAGSVQELITARLTDLREAARGPVLDAEDPWAVKVEGLAGVQDAADALAELDGLLGAGSVDQARAGRVRAAVLARFPGAAA